MKSKAVRLILGGSIQTSIDCEIAKEPNLFRDSIHQIPQIIGPIIAILVRKQVFNNQQFINRLKRTIEIRTQRLFF